MTRDDIIRMAREAGFEDGYGNHLFPPGDYREEVVPVTDEIIRFATLLTAEKDKEIKRLQDMLYEQLGELTALRAEKQMRTHIEQLKEVLR
jgi:hypothetical protein